MGDNELPGDPIEYWSMTETEARLIEEQNECFRKRIAELEDGLRELAQCWLNCDARSGGEADGLARCARDVLPLLGKEPAPSPPAADDGTDAADGVGS